ncbi:cytochrome P450 [Actinomadura fibrosa]|uniref:Cytochrome P450 n=1 Tax=Actinomadura fibrosa TaxID=111802 RepID=A0ABW2XPH2_9ACTN|nr:cytochrome P450 [Actinomadura fibrosa]
MTDAAELDLPFFDYSAPDLTGEVYHRRLAETARHGWLAQAPLSYVVLDRESAEFFLRSRATAFPGPQIADLFGVTGGRLREQIDANIVNQTGERHRRLRSLVGPAFAPRAAGRWRPVMRGFLDGLWDPARTSCDAVEAFARPYPALTIAAVFGAPAADAPRLQAWSAWVQRQFDIRALAADLPAIERATAEVYAYVEDLLAARRDAPGDDLLSTLLAAEDEGDRLSRAECVNLVLNVMAGGIDTMQAQLAHALRLFAEHPDQWALLAAEPGRAARAVDEVLRFEPITPFTARVCLEPVEFRGVAFPAGAIVAVCAERANRDEGEEFDITAVREHRPLTFGAGAHYCLGANLARAELEEALAFLAPRMPGLALDGPPRLGGVEGIYGVESLPVRWRPPR